MFKKFTATIFLSGKNAIKSISNREILSEDPVSLALNYMDHFADLLLIFDLSKSLDEHEDALLVVEDITSVCNIPVWLAGNIMSADDVARIIDIGCEKAVLNFSKESNVRIATGLANEMHREHLAGAITNSSLLIDYETLLKESVSELVLMKDSELNTCINLAPLPIVVPVQDMTPDMFMNVLENENISGVFGNFVNANLDDLHSIKVLCKEKGLDVDAFTPSLTWNDLKLNSDGLIPVIVQDYLNNDVLMMAYMNEVAFNKTVTCGQMVYFSRSRQALWHKGETSGHFQFVKSLYADCDSDTLLAKVSQVGAACHTGKRSCFFKEIVNKDKY